MIYLHWPYSNMVIVQFANCQITIKLLRWSIYNLHDITLLHHSIIILHLCIYQNWWSHHLIIYNLPAFTIKNMVDSPILPMKIALRWSHRWHKKRSKVLRRRSPTARWPAQSPPHPGPRRSWKTKILLVLVLDPQSKKKDDRTRITGRIISFWGVTHGSERSENLIDWIDIDPFPKPFNVVLA